MDWLKKMNGSISYEETENVIINLWKRVFTEWFPISEYEVADGPQLEIYPVNTKTVEVWVPIVKK